MQAWFGDDLEPFFILVHLAWFVLPGCLTLYVICFHWSLFGRLVFVRLAVLYLALIRFFVFPTEPPWVEADVTRFLGLSVTDDPNPYAAMPSLHVALPAVITLWCRAARLHKVAAFYGVFKLLTVLAVVYLGEHHVLDIAAGLVLAVVVFWIMDLVMGRPRTAVEATDRPEGQPIPLELVPHAPTAQPIN